MSRHLLSRPRPRLFAKQLLVFAVPCAVFLLRNCQTLRDLTTTSDVELIRQEPYVSEICKLAYNLDMESENYRSYQLDLDWSNVDHVTKKLCHRLQFFDNGVERQKMINNDTATFTSNNNTIYNDTSVILTFKVARSGSTFFTDVIMKALQTMKRAANLNWEPYCRVGCYKRKSSAVMESELSTILSSNCTDITQDRQLCASNGSHGKCCPVPKCNSTRFHLNAMSVVSLNPRFSDTVRWNKILTPSFPPTSFTRVFNLRRTNLVKLAYSKYHHDGCAVTNGNGSVNDECIPENKNSSSFSFGCLLQCVQHYGIGDQEFSSSVAFGAAKNTKLQQPHLVLYEDVMHDQLHASKQVFDYIGVKVDEGDNFFNSTTEEKLHGDDICGYHDVNCTDWRLRLENGYPCLLKQLESNSTVAWSAPIERVAKRTIKLSIHGDCHRLENLDKDNNKDRLYEELYLNKKDVKRSTG